VGAVERPRRREADVEHVECRDRRHRYPFNAPTRMPRVMNRSSATAITTTGVIMMRISTDIAHHCGPRVAFCAATWSGIVWAFALVRTRAIRNSFQAKIRTMRNVATRPGTEIGRTIERTIRYTDAPSTAADSSSSRGSEAKYSRMSQTTIGRLAAT